MPTSSRASSRTRPAGPTNGWPARSSWSPGCSPTIISSARPGPSPNTVCVPVRNRSHARHPRAAWRRASSDGRGSDGRNGVASHGSSSSVTRLEYAASRAPQRELPLTVTNRLAGETSPYLLQHAHNPVDWYPWGEEALTRARAENKPILLSIGYSACHWCHVMEHESFEDEAIAQLMNEHFINIKVDREERPDLDQVYMNAVQMMTGHGGWPMTVFLTPDLVPFYGGTYFPPVDRHNLPGFPRVLAAVAEAYRQDPQGVAQTAASVLKELRRMSMTHESGVALTASTLDLAYGGIAR